MKDSYKTLILYGKALSPTATELCHTKLRMTHFFEHSREIWKDISSVSRLPTSLSPKTSHHISSKGNHLT